MSLFNIAKAEQDYRESPAQLTAGAHRLSRKDVYHARSKLILDYLRKRPEDWYDSGTIRRELSIPSGSIRSALFTLLKERRVECKRTRIRQTRYAAKYLWRIVQEN